jgi:hypothetical protein
MKIFIYNFGEMCPFEIILHTYPSVARLSENIWGQYYYSIIEIRPWSGFGYNKMRHASSVHLRQLFIFAALKPEVTIRLLWNHSLVD